MTTERKTLDRDITGSCFHCYHEQGARFSEFRLIREDPVPIYKCRGCKKQYGPKTIASMTRRIRDNESK